MNLIAFLPSLHLLWRVESEISSPLPGMLDNILGIMCYCCSVAQWCLTLCHPMACSNQASLSFTIPQSLRKLVSIELVIPSNHLLCCPFLLPLSIFPSIRGFSHESALCIRWPNYWNFSFSISPSNGYSDWFPLGWTGLISLQSKGLSRVFSNITVQKHQFFSAQLSLCLNSHIHSWLLENRSFDYVLLGYPQRLLHVSCFPVARTTGICWADYVYFSLWGNTAAAAAKSLQSCPTLCDPRDSSPPGSRPWDSPGKSTGVGCHFLLQCMEVKSESEGTQSSNSSWPHGL